MHPLTIHISTRDNTEQREVHRQYIVQSNHPRWEMVKIFLHAFFHVRFR
jgi:hypothetical protein